PAIPTSPHNHPLNGLIDEVAIYSRALTAQEISNIYNASKAGKCIETYSQISQLALTTNDIIYDPFSRRIYASVPGRAGSPRGNSITPVNPFAETIGSSVFIGSEPRKLAVADNGQYLYVDLSGIAAVRRFDIPSQTPGLQFSLGTDPNFGPNYAEDLEVLPGQAEALAVTLQNAGRTPRHAGVVIYDNNVQRPNTTTGANVIEFSNSASRLYGYGNESDFDFFRWNVDSTGITGGASIRNLIIGAGVDIEFDAGRIYATSGRVIDAEAGTLVGVLPAGLVRPDSAVGVVYVLTQSGSTATIRAFDVDTFLQVGQAITVSGLSGTAGSFIRWGPDGIAFRTSGGQIFLIRASLVAPIVVTTAADTVNAGDGVTSLREAITAANARFGAVILFRIPGPGPYPITPTSTLPPITFSTIIDGTSQPGFSGTPIIELNGSSAGPNVSGLTITGGNSVVRGLAINRFQGNGIVLQTNGGNVLQGNFIGTAGDGSTNLGNTGAGVLIDGVGSNTVGGLTPGASNLIAFNGTGVRVLPGGGNTGVSNAILSNSIHSNTGLGIDLGSDGVTANDDSGTPPDTDAGANMLQNFPVLTSAVSSGGNTTIAGTLKSTPNSTFRLEFFTNNDCDSSGSGEGQTFLGSFAVTTDADGLANFNPTFASATAAVSLTATATSADNNTSEFSPCAAIAASGTLRFDQASYSVNENDGSATITVIREGGSVGAVSVHYTTSDGTATQPADYTTASGTLNFAAGVTSQTFTIPIVNDTHDEAAETVYLTLSDPAGGAVLGTGSTALLTIVDDDAPPTLSINDVQVAEGHSGTTPATFTISLSTASELTVTVNYATANGTATAGSDYTTASGTVTFVPGDVEETISVPVIGNAQQESNETFFVNLSAPSNATLADGQGQGTIINDDFAPVNVSVTPSNSSSGAGGPRTFTAIYTDANGATDIADARILISATGSGSNAIYGRYDRTTNRLYLMNNTATGFMGGFAPGSNTVISDPNGGQGSLNCATTTVNLSGNTLTINWSFAPAIGFIGTKNLYLYVKDNG
ncbi:MAG: hypothetical protein M3347_10415, partial [Armatimonadota bacterium]|nr:hypothetical protein [Armatimonadota bacterium]